MSGDLSGAVSVKTLLKCSAFLTAGYIISISIEWLWAETPGEIFSTTYEHNSPLNRACTRTLEHIHTWHCEMLQAAPRCPSLYFNCSATHFTWSFVSGHNNQTSARAFSLIAMIAETTDILFKLSTSMHSTRNSFMVLDLWVAQQC